jgi:RNA polymerase-binding protein DksA
MSPRSVRRELESTRAALSGKIASSMESRRGQQSGREFFKDPYGNATMTLDDEITAAVVERRARILKELDSALQDIDDGCYGVCRDCGRRIAEARLRVMPSATRCVRCQTAVEQAKAA